MRLIATSLLIMFSLFLSCGDDESLLEPIPNDPSLYFPTTGQWETQDLASLGWQTGELDPLLSYLEASNTDAFLLLHKGRIVIEAYFGATTSTDNKPWFSAGKTLTALLSGIATQEGTLDLETSTQEYLGEGWSGMPVEEESAILLRHHLSMTTGLDDGVIDPFCTEPDCLQRLTAPNERWAYHNGPYNLISHVIESASGLDYNSYTSLKLSNAIGMNGSWVDLGFNRIYFSTPRSMARFGLLLLAQGQWDGRQMIESTFLNQMTNSSQSINPAYGHLTWLNGQGSYMIPGVQVSFAGPITPSAPADMYAAMGRNGQLINVVPSMDLVIIRMGDSPDNGLVPFSFQEELWTRLNRLF